MAHVIYSTLVVDTQPITVDSLPVARLLVQAARQAQAKASEVLSTSSVSAFSFLTRFHFDEDDLQGYLDDTSEGAHSLPVAVDIGGETWFIEMALQDDVLKLSVHNMNNDDDEPRALIHPIHVEVRSLASSPITLHNDFLFTYQDVDEDGSGYCCIPASQDVLISALIQGVSCMVSWAEVPLEGVQPSDLKATEKLF